MQLQFAHTSSECHMHSIMEEDNQLDSSNYQPVKCSGQNHESRLESSHVGAREELAQLYSRGTIDILLLFSVFLIETMTPVQHSILPIFVCLFRTMHQVNGFKKLCVLSPDLG